MWWTHSNPTCCNESCLNVLFSLVVGTLKYLLILNHVLVPIGGRDTETLFLHALPFGLLEGDGKGT